MTTWQNGNGGSTPNTALTLAKNASLQMTISVQMMLLLKEPRAASAVRALAFVFVDENMAMMERNAPGSTERANWDGARSVRDELTGIYLGAAEQAIHADANETKSLDVGNTH